MTSRMQNALRLAKPPVNAVGLDRFCELANFELVNCLDWLEAPFPLSYRKKELRSLEQDEYFAPKVYLKSREWFRIEPDDTVNSFSFWYADGSRTNLNSFAYSQSINLVVFVNTERVFTEDNIHVETLINQTLQTLKKSFFFESIPEGTELEVFEGLEDAWEDFDITTVNGQQFIKENYATFRIRFDVVYNLTDCLPCEEVAPPIPEDEYYLALTELNQDLLLLGAESPLFTVVPSSGDWFFSIRVDVDSLRDGTCNLLSHSWPSGSGADMDRYNINYSPVTDQIRFNYMSDSNIRYDGLNANYDGVVEIRGGFDDLGAYISINGVEVERTSDTARPTNVLGIRGFWVNATFNADLVTPRPTTISSFDVYEININGALFRLREGQGYTIIASSGDEGQGQTANQGGITYWDEFVWQEITN